MLLDFDVREKQGINFLIGGNIIMDQYLDFKVDILFFKLKCICFSQRCRFSLHKTG